MSDLGAGEGERLVVVRAWENGREASVSQGGPDGEAWV